MPIKFACPKCNKVLSVPDNMAGKSGKCKCGHQIKIPAAKSEGSGKKSKSSKTAPTPAAVGGEAPGLAGKFDELTESDYGRTSPFDAVYNPKKTNNDLQTLQRFNAEEKEEQKKKASAAGGLLQLVAVLNILSGILCIVSLVLLFAAAATAATIAKQLPELSLSTAIAATMLSVIAVICIGGGVGVFLKKPWGWTLTAAMIIYWGLARAITSYLVLKDGFEQMTFFGCMIPLFVILVIGLIVFKDEAKQVCGVKNIVPTIVAAVIGLALTGIVYGIVFTSSSQP